MMPVQLDQPTLYALGSVLYHFIQSGVDDVEVAASKALTHIVYDPLEERSPEFFAEHLEVALNSNAPLSKLYPDFSSSEIVTRKYVQRLVERIRAGQDKPKIEIDANATLHEKTKNRLLELFRPMQGSKVSTEDRDALAQEIGNLELGHHGTHVYVTAIKRAVRSQVRLAQFTPPGWSEQAIRDYLLDLGRRILRVEETANHRRRVMQMAVREHEATAQSEIDPGHFPEK